MAKEFLPICDLIFNVISLTTHFCDVVFDLITIYTLFAQQEMVWFMVALSFVLISFIVSHVCSFIWHVNKVRRDQTRSDSRFTITAYFLGGIFTRYVKLFKPVDIRYVKHEIRDLCLLRLIHAFCEAIPMLLLQLYLIWLKPSLADVTYLNVVSTAFSLFSVCWALASFSKNFRKHNVHLLELTWLGIIFQFGWRFGTVTSRVLTLTIYAADYGGWMFFVVALHWISMYIWLAVTDSVFHGEKMPRGRKVLFSMLIAFCYVFCYINLQEVNKRQNMVIFYVMMFLENTVLISACLVDLQSPLWYRPATGVVFLCYFVGILSMFIYYRCLHVRKQKNCSVATPLNYDLCTGCQLGQCTEKSHRMPHPFYLNEISTSENSTIASNNQITVKVNSSGESFHQYLYSHTDGLQVPGVFNCRFNPGIKRKKKKPTSFVPPPARAIVCLNVPNNTTSNGHVLPFWKRPLPQSVSSDHEGSVGSRVNIQQKLQEKKQQQIAELRQIEEEIRTGKLKRPHPCDISESGTLRQPIPRAKKQPWVQPEPPVYRQVISDSSGNAPLPASRKIRSQTPEILLAPHYLENSRIYYEYQDPRWKYCNNYHLPSDEVSGSSLSKHSAKKRNHKGENYDNREKVTYKSYRIPSDLDSQISLPRSYTLPREFKYYRRPKSRKMIRTDHFLASTNSSDGDVDSCDDGDLMQSSTCLNNALHLHSDHNHNHHHHHHHSFLHHHQIEHVTPPNPSPFKARLAGPFHRNLANTHETKL